MAQPDVFDEIRDEVRSRNLKKLARKVLPYVIGAVVGILLATLGRQGYSHWTEQQLLADAQMFDEAIQAVNKGLEGKGLELFREIAAKDGSYSRFAALRAAEIYQQRGDYVAASEEYQLLIRRSGLRDIYRLYAELRSAILDIESGRATDKLERIRPLAEAEGPFRPAALEYAALVALEIANHRQAEIYLGMLLESPDVPNGTQARAAAILTAMGSSFVNGDVSDEFSAGTESEPAVQKTDEAAATTQ